MVVKIYRQIGQKMGTGKRKPKEQYLPEHYLEFDCEVCPVNTMYILCKLYSTKLYNFSLNKIQKHAPNYC